MTTQHRTILLIEDNDDDVALITRMIESVRPDTITVEVENTLQDGLARLESASPDLLILDLNLPDSGHTETFSRVQDFSHDTPTIILTANDDESIAAECINRGAQDYLVKGQYDSRLLVRSINYAIDRHAMQAELQRVQEEAAWERDRESLERLGERSHTAVASRLFSAVPLAESMPERHREFVEAYRELLGEARHEQLFRVDHHSSNKLQDLADQLGLVNADPRDIIQIHRDALAIMQTGMSPKVRRSMFEESRYRLIELLGYLVAFYRQHAAAGPTRRQREE